MPVPQFEVETLDGDLIRNRDTEYSEQEILAEISRDGDRMLQLGANIGTSCITAARSAAVSPVVCVEPFGGLMDTLSRNTAKDPAIKLVHGVISSDVAACANMRMTEDSGGYGSRTAPDAPGSAVQCHSLSSVSPPGGFSVIFADCEGCFPGFLQEHAAELRTNHPHLRAVVYERDYAEVADYGMVQRYLESEGFRCETRGYNTVCLR